MPRSSNITQRNNTIKRNRTIKRKNTRRRARTRQRQHQRQRKRNIHRGGSVSQYILNNLITGDTNYTENEVIVLSSMVKNGAKLRSIGLFDFRYMQKVKTNVTNSAQEVLLVIEKQFTPENMSMASSLLAGQVNVPPSANMKLSFLIRLLGSGKELIAETEAEPVYQQWASAQKGDPTAAEYLVKQAVDSNFEETGGLTGLVRLLYRETHYDLAHMVPQFEPHRAPSRTKIKAAPGTLKLYIKLWAGTRDDMKQKQIITLLLLMVKYSRHAGVRFVGSVFDDNLETIIQTINRYVPGEDRSLLVTELKNLFKVELLPSKRVQTRPKRGGGQRGGAPPVPLLLAAPQVAITMIMVWVVLTVVERIIGMSMWEWVTSAIYRPSDRQ
jgi:hypothetical protein